MSPSTELLIEDYLDGSLSAAGAAELAALLAGDGGAELRQRIAFAGLLAQALDPADGDAVARSVLTRIEAEESPSRMVRAVRRSIRPRRRRSAWPLAAAALLLAAFTVWMLAPVAAPVAVCSLFDGTAQLQRNGRGLHVSAGTPLLAGDTLRAETRIRLRWDDGSDVALAAGAEAVIGRDLRLEHGELEAEVATQPLGAPFAITTPEARVEVLGTRFHLAVGDGRTRCALHAGAVRLVRLADGRDLILAPGQGAEVAPGTELSSFPLTVAPVEAAWSPLFPAADLAGWRQQHGAWTNRDGVVRSSAPSGGKVRLLSEREHGDLELTCRLRIRGADLAEVQVGDYNWFFEVPARNGAWVEVRLRQHGATLACSADGIALEPQPGAGQPPRPGPLAFYVLPGGSLEITDARIR